MESKIKSIADIKTSSAGWSTVMVETEHGSGEVFLGKNVISHDLVEGMSIEFDKEDSQYGVKFKIKGFRDGKFQKPSTKMGGGGFNPAKERAINASVALSKAVELVCHDKLEIKSMYAAADKMLEWLMEKSK